MLIEAMWRLGWLHRILPLELLDWVIVVWPWSRLLVHAEEASLPLGLFILMITLLLNVLLYAAVGALVGALVALARRPP